MLVELGLVEQRYAAVREVLVYRLLRWGFPVRVGRVLLTLSRRDSRTRVFESAAPFPWRPST
ncbi:MAG TPA: hypothetical protein VIK95_06180 [Egibacteraceae bacterium]